MKLIQELVEDIQYIKEDKDGKESLYLTGTFAQAEIANRNKRIYRLPILEGEINRYVKENVNTNRAMGELGHPQGPNINLDRVAIHIKELNRDGNNFNGKALVASTPMGKVCENLINDGARLGVSTRALGSLKPLKDGLNEVQDDLKLLAIDVVADPSAPDAFVQGIMESREYLFDFGTNTWVQQVAEQTQKQLKTMPLKQIELNKVKLFERWLQSLEEGQATFSTFPPTKQNMKKKKDDRELYKGLKDILSRKSPKIKSGNLDDFTKSGTSWVDEYLPDITKEIIETYTHSDREIDEVINYVLHKYGLNIYKPLR